MNSTRHSSQIYCINYIGLTWRFLGLTFTLPLDCKFKFSWLLCIADSFFFLLSKNNITNVLAQSSWVTTKHGLLFFFSFAVLLVFTLCAYHLTANSCNQVQYMGDHSHISMELDEVSLYCFSIFTWCIINSVNIYHFHILIEFDEVSFYFVLYCYKIAG